MREGVSLRRNRYYDWSRRRKRQQGVQRRSAARQMFRHCAGQQRLPIHHRRQRSRLSRLSVPACPATICRFRFLHRGLQSRRRRNDRRRRRNVALHRSRHVRDGGESQPAEQKLSRRTDVRCERSDGLPVASRADRRIVRRYGTRNHRRWRRRFEYETSSPSRAKSERRHHRRTQRRYERRDKRWHRARRWNQWRNDRRHGTGRRYEWRNNRWTRWYYRWTRRHDRRYRRRFLSAFLWLFISLFASIRRCFIGLVNRLLLRHDSGESHLRCGPLLHGTLRPMQRSLRSREQRPVEFRVFSCFFGKVLHFEFQFPRSSSSLRCVQPLRRRDLQHLRRAGVRGSRTLFLHTRFLRGHLQARSRSVQSAPTAFLFQFPFQSFVILHLERIFHGLLLRHRE